MAPGRIELAERPQAKSRSSRGCDWHLRGSWQARVLADQIDDSAAPPPGLVGKHLSPSSS
jgi:hypothetical protein